MKSNQPNPTKTTVVVSSIVLACILAVLVAATTRAVLWIAGA